MKEDAGKALKLEEVCELFLKALGRFYKVYICIDALDECMDNHRKQLLAMLENVLGDPTLKQSARLFLTGRLHMEDYVLANMTKFGPPVRVTLKANSGH
jgi:ADP-heptose:LPS heptosyltransferase